MIMDEGFLIMSGSIMALIHQSDDSFHYFLVFTIINELMNPAI